MPTGLVFFISKRFSSFFFSIFFYTEKTKKNPGLPTGHRAGHALDRKQTIFEGGLSRVGPGGYKECFLYFLNLSCISVFLL